MQKVACVTCVTPEADSARSVTVSFLAVTLAADISSSQKRTLANFLRTPDPSVSPDRTVKLASLPMWQRSLPT